MSSRLATTCSYPVLAACLLIAGCYDGQSLVEEVRNQAIQSRLDEMSIGHFRTTLPRSAVDDHPMELEVDLFGTAVRHRIPAIEAAIEANSYRLRQSVLVALRQTSAAEIADPNLTTFRQRLLKVVQTELEGSPIESIGFRSVRFIPL